MGLIMFLHLSTSEMLHKSPAMDDLICLLLLTVYLRAEFLRNASMPRSRQQRWEILLSPLRLGTFSAHFIF